MEGPGSPSYRRVILHQVFQEVVIKASFPQLLLHQLNIALLFPFLDASSALLVQVDPEIHPSWTVNSTDLVDIPRVGLCTLIVRVVFHVVLLRSMRCQTLPLWGIARQLYVSRQLQVLRQVHLKSIVCRLIITQGPQVPALFLLLRRPPLVDVDTFLQLSGVLRIHWLLIIGVSLPFPAPLACAQPALAVTSISIILVIAEPALPLIIIPVILGRTLASTTLTALRGGILARLLAILEKHVNDGE